MIVVIIAGGAGTRLWPISRESHPKPFLKLADGQSLLQKTFLRASRLPNVESIVTVTNRDVFFKTVDEYQVVNERQLPLSYILEPEGRNTAPAVLAAALQVVLQHSRDSTLLVLPADHIIQNQQAFSMAVENARRLAQENKLVTFGIKPEYPETGYGYIQLKNNTETNVARFVEKPTLDVAKEYLESGEFFWNAGMFCFQAQTLIDEFEIHAPEMLQKLQQCLKQSRDIHNAAMRVVELEANTFQNVSDISIDYALMEKSQKVAMVTCDIGWSDVGSWNAFNDFAAADDKGNRVEGEALLHESQNCYIQSQERLVAAVGVNDLIIVDTPDALLVANRQHAQDVKHIVNKLKQNGHESHRVHKTVHRPWGSYTILEEGEYFKIKRLEVKPGALLSLQTHHHRSEHWVVISGVARVTNGEKVFDLQANESTFIPANNKHRLENIGLVDLVVIEVQSGDYLGEDDIVRYEDSYGRF